MTVKNNFCSSRRAEEQKLFFALPYFRFLPFFFFLFFFRFVLGCSADLVNNFRAFLINLDRCLVSSCSHNVINSGSTAGVGVTDTGIGTASGDTAVATSVVPSSQSGDTFSTAANAVTLSCLATYLLLNHWLIDERPIPVCLDN